jgi:hypothetical protein
VHDEEGGGNELLIEGDWLVDFDAPFVLLYLLAIGELPLLKIEFSFLQIG